MAYEQSLNSGHEAGEGWMDILMSPFFWAVVLGLVGYLKLVWFGSDSCARKTGFLFGLAAWGIGLSSLILLLAWIPEVLSHHVSLQQLLRADDSSWTSRKFVYVFVAGVVLAALSFIHASVNRFWGIDEEQEDD